MRYTWMLAGLLAACSGDDKGGGGNGEPEDTGTGPVTHPEADADLDGVSEAGGDCDDNNSGVHPGAAEACDGLDNDCNGSIDEGLDRNFYADADGDGFGDALDSIVDCQPVQGHVLDANDCDDTNPLVNPNAQEVCDDLDVDEDCSGAADDLDPNAQGAWTYYTDVDGDGYGDPATGAVSCSQPANTVTNGYDCRDDDLTVNPHAQEVCDGTASDDDCDGLVDDADPESFKDDYWPDDDGDTFGDAATSVTTTCFDLSASGFVFNDDDCNDARDDVNPDMIELCNAAEVDEDCDGDIDEDDDDTDTESWYVDNDSDGYGQTGSTAIVTCEILSGWVVGAGDCNDSNANINPAEDELCNDSEIDEDCDGKVDEADPETPAIDYFTDTDGDGYGPDSTLLSTCNTVSGRVTLGGDCNESDNTINPGAFDDCDDGIDNNCDTVTDNCQIGDVDLDDADLIVNGSTSYTYSGIDVSDVGDINSDGTPDLAIGTMYASTYTGLASIVFGPATGTMTTASADVDLTGGAYYQYFGYAIAGEADLDDDSNTDLIVGTNYGDKAYVYYGPITADTTTAGAGATLSSAVAYDYLGYHVDLLDDWDGDGFGEAVAIAPYGKRAAGMYSTGVAYIFAGPVTGAISGASADYIIGGSANYDYLGGLSTTGRSALGDMDADGLEDLVLSAPYKGGGSYYSQGYVYVMYGGSLATGTHDVASAADAIVTGAASNYYLGWGVAGRADYDGDGYDDLIAGAPQAYSSSFYGGLTYAFLGPLSGTLTTSSYDARWEGESYEYSGEVVSAGHLNDDGKSDIVVGAGNHTGTVAYGGGAYLVLGGQLGSYMLDDDAFAVLEGPTIYGYAGERADFISDWDGDGKDEVAVSSTNQTTGTAYYSGRTRVFSGGSLFP